MSIKKLCRLLFILTASVLGAIPTHASQPLAGQSALDVSPMRFVIAGLLCVILLILLVVIRQRASRQDGSIRFADFLSGTINDQDHDLEIKSIKRLVGGSHLIVTKWGDREFLLAATTSTITLIDQRGLDPSVKTDDD